MAAVGESPVMSEYQQPLGDRVNTLPVAYQHLADERQAALVPCSHGARHRDHFGVIEARQGSVEITWLDRGVGIQQQYRAEPFDQAEAVDRLLEGAGFADIAAGGDDID